MIPFGLIAQDLPKPKNSVNDFANIISNIEESQLNKSIIDYQNSSGMEICVLTLETIPNDEDIFDFSVKQFKNWGIGKASSDNGIIIIY